jgi:pimeloyl-ACP methyl ester carboxylesterase
VLVPGFKGTKLQRPNGDVVWITPGRAVFGGGSLAIGNPAIGIENEELLAGDILSRVDVLPWAYHFDVYHSFIEHLEEAVPNSVVVELAYDWRQDNLEAVKSLSKLLRDLRNKGASRVSLVGHSMGGTIVAYFLRYGPQEYAAAKESWEGSELVDAAVIAGAPLLGSFEIVHDMQLGDTTIFNSSLLDADALCTFPSSYQLIPFPPEESFEIQPPLDLFDVRVWMREGFGLFRNRAGLSAEMLKAREKYVDAELRRAKLRYSLLQAPSTRARSKDIPLLNIVGVAFGTRRRVAWPGRVEDLDSLPTIFGPGDGLVPEPSAELPIAYSRALRVRRSESQGVHDRLLTEEKVLVADFLAGKD